MTDKQNGMSIVELIIVIAITGILTGTIFTFAINYMRIASRQQADMTSMVDRLNASDYLREHLGQSSGLSNQNSIIDANVGAQDPGKPAGYWQELHAVPGLKSNAASITPLLYFKKMSINTSNEVVYNGELPYEDEYIIYMDYTTRELRVRILANPNALNNKAISSCPPASATSSCPADRILSTGLTGVSTKYYDRSGNESNYESVVQKDEFGNTVYDTNGNPIYEGPDFPIVEVIELQLKLATSFTPSPTDVTNSSTTIRVALRND